MKRAAIYQHTPARMHTCKHAHVMHTTNEKHVHVHTWRDV